MIAGSSEVIVATTILASLIGAVIIGVGDCWQFNNRISDIAVNMDMAFTISIYQGQVSAKN